MAKATKAARELAAEKGISLDSIDGTGSGGQITKEDVQNAPQEDAAQEDTSEQAPQEQRSGATATPLAESIKSRDESRAATAAGEALRSQLKTTTADMHDSRIKQGAAVARGGRDLAGAPEKGAIGQASGNIQRVGLSRQGGNVADDQKVNLVFNPASGTSRLLHEGSTYEPGDEVSLDKFNELKTLKSDGKLIFDEEATTGGEKSELSPEEQQSQAANFNAEADQSSDEQTDQQDAEDAEDSTASADENKED